MNILGAGDYNRRFLRQVYDTEKNTSTKEREISFTDGAKFWGRLKELTANERLAYGATFSMTDCRIFLRGYRLNIDSKDRLKDTETNEVFEIDGVIIDKTMNETLLLCHRFKDVRAQ